ncbi:hypothetical protein [Cognatazoarcus halotolerans]|uniref:hypothetical protein n=1 Tax=Cognatazoarcus halotolerans TaxID=2686016 RepID=UPI001356BEE3|nr:hypothetical protein [Cognatazoarcus halotolerans]
MRTSTHATVRCQQRGIPALVLDLLLQFGHREHDHAGAEIVYFNHRSKKRIESYAGGLISKLNEYLDSYAVVAAGEIVTVGHRYKRINRN